jgi:hypothetical protein
MTLNGRGQTCDLPACATGQHRANDGLHCCWPEQGWSMTRSLCVGIPKCPKGMEVENDIACVPLDKDGDGIPNKVDKCPDQPEDFNGYQDADGCPDEAERLAMLRASAAKAAADAAAAAALVEQKRRAEEQAKKAAADAEAKRQRDAADAAAAVARAAADAERAEKNAARRRRRIGGAVAMGIGGGLGVASFTFMGLGALQNGSIHDGGFANAAAIQSANSTGNTYNTAAIATGIIGAVGFTTGFILVVASPTIEAPPTADLVLTPLSGGAMLSGHF